LPLQVIIGLLHAYDVSLSGWSVLVRHVQFVEAKQELNMLVPDHECTRTVEDSRSPVDKFGSFWCSLMHDSLSWPIHGHYTCLTCGRRHLVGWEREALPPPAALKNANLPANAEHFTSSGKSVGDGGRRRAASAMGHRYGNA
jgi:hypothetical protein